MLPVFLTSNGLYDEVVFDNFVKILEEYKVDKKICLITTAIRDPDNRRFHTNKTMAQLTNAGFSTVDFIDIEYDKPQILFNYPIVCIFGGDPFYLLNQIKRVKVDDILIDKKKNGCLIVGHSSGAAVLGKTIKHANILHPEWNEVGLTDFDAIGIIPEIILPHHNRYKGQEQNLMNLEINENIKLTRIDDGQWIII